MSAKLQNTRQDRRRYFRFTVEATLSFEPLSDNAAPFASRGVAGENLDRIDLGHGAEAGSADLAGIVSYLKELDRRVNYLYDLLLWKNARGKGELIDQVCLNGLGVAFHTSAPLAVGKKLKVSLLLVKSQSGVVTAARVVRCDLAPAGGGRRPYVVALEFENISQAHQDLLMRYVLQQQGADLSRNRIPPTGA